MRIYPLLSLCLLATLNASPAAHAAAPDATLQVLHSTLSSAQAQPAADAALSYASFWHTGKEVYLKAALAADFQDRSLPAGRAQGIAGALAASRQFRTAIPDLSAVVEEMLATENTVVLRLHFYGHFSGRLGELQGHGQPVDFMALDMYRIEQGRISDNWHLEDHERLNALLNKAP